MPKFQLPKCLTANQSDYACKDRGAGLKLHRAYQRIYKANLSKGNLVQAEGKFHKYESSISQLDRGQFLKLNHA